MDNIFELIAENYTAANDIHEADYTPTTAEIYQKLIAHTGMEALTQEAVFAFMHGTGFKQMDIGELHFVWLMKSDFPVLSGP